jgi:biopolymer transport protein ExbD
MGFKEIKVQEEVSANLVPMIDIMFLLLLFFMLNADMSQRELEEVTTPVANQAMEDKPDENTDRITLNVFHAGPDEKPCEIHAAGEVCREGSHWMISVAGQRFELQQDANKVYFLTDAVQKTLDAQLREVADKRREDPNDPKSPSARHMIIRADRYAPYGVIQRALERAAVAGIYKTEVAAQIEKSSLKQ